MSDTQQNETLKSENDLEQLPADADKTADPLGESDFAESDKSEELEEVQKDAAEERKEGGYQ